MQVLPTCLIRDRMSTCFFKVQPGRDTSNFFSQSVKSWSVPSPGPVFTDKVPNEVEGGA